MKRIGNARFKLISTEVEKSSILLHQEIDFSAAFEIKEKVNSLILRLR